MRCAALALVLALALPGAAAAAITCRVTIAPFAFGNYMPADSAPLDVTGQIDVRCMGTAGIFLATLSPGSSGSFGERRMLFGPEFLRYNFYLNAARTIVFGDGTGGSWPSGGLKLRPGRQDFVLPVYGRVFPGQGVGAGTYRDDVLVTIVF